MARMGHDDMRAALIYQRATQEAAERIAEGLSDLADRHRGTDETTAADHVRWAIAGGHDRQLDLETTKAQVGGWRL